MLEHSARIPGDGYPFPPATTATITLVRTIAVGIIYFISATFSLFLALQHTNASPVWPPAGIALAAVLCLGYRVSPGIFVGAFLANIFVLKGFSLGIDATSAAAFLTAAGNTLEAVTGAFLVRRFVGNGYVFENMRTTLIFVVFGVLPGAVLSATIGVTSLCAATGNWSIFRSAWVTWWLGDSTGAVLIAPLLLSWRAREYSLQGYERIVEAVVAFALLVAISWTAFVRGYPLQFLIIPVLLWTTIRFSLAETSLAVTVMSAIAVYSATATSNPSAHGYFRDSLIVIQSYIGVIAATALFLSVVVSERRRSGEAVQAEIAFNDIVINSIPGAFYVIDGKGELVRCNHFLEDLNDLCREEGTGPDSLRNIHEDDRERIMGRIAQAFENGEFEAEGRIQAKDGARHFFFTGRRIEVHGDPYVVGTGIDITERKVAELQLGEYQRDLEAKVGERTAELREVNAVLAAEVDERRRVEGVLLESEAKYRDLVEGADSVILRWTAEGEVIFINRFAREFFGFSDDEIIGRSILGTIVPADKSAQKNPRPPEGNTPGDSEPYLLNEKGNVKKNGDKVWVAWTNRAIVDADGRISQILSVGNDITPRKLVEDRLKTTLDELAAARDRAEAADRLKSAFLATMSHELRTPLNSIIGFTGIILKGYVGALNEEQAKQLNMVYNSATHLLSLINDVLDISKIEAGQLQVSAEPFSLRALIDKTVQSSRPASDRKGLVISTDISPGIDTLVSDRRRVEQVLLNLLSNAIKFTEHGEVHVECSRIDSSARISVTDSGIGIRDEDIPKLFRAFQQVDSGTARKFEGTGLGLYICRRLLTLLGGKIWVTSKWGAGSTFCFTLPLERSIS